MAGGGGCGQRGAAISDASIPELSLRLLRGAAQGFCSTSMSISLEELWIAPVLFCTASVVSDRFSKVCVRSRKNVPAKLQQGHLQSTWNAMPEERWFASYSDVLG